MNENGAINYSTKYVPTIRAFMESNAMIRIMLGPWGSGKSVGCMMELIRRSQLQTPNPQGIRKTRWAIVRNTYRELQDTTQKTFFEWLQHGIHGEYHAAKKTFVFAVPPGDGTRVHSELIFLALDQPDDARHLLSLELTGVYFNELKEIAKKIFDDAGGRTNRYPPIKDGGATWAGIIADTNPPDSDHWLYKLLEEESHLYPPSHPKAGQVFLEKFHQPSGLAKHPDGKWVVPVMGVHAENLPNLSETYYEDLCLAHDEDWVEVNVHARYGYVKDGRPVYLNWKPIIHVAKAPIEIVKAYPLILGWDFGYQNSACIMCQQLPNGLFHVKHEFPVDYMDTRQFARDKIRPFIFANYLGMDIIGTGDPAGGGHAPSDGMTCIRELAEAGLPIEPPETNDWDPRYGAVNSLLMKRLEGDQPAFQVDPECKKLIKGFNGEYKYKRLYDRRYDRYGDKPLKNEYSHIHDALQYAALFMERGIHRYRRRRTVAATAKPLPAGAWT